jgi:hypothetical protein
MPFSTLDPFKRPRNPIPSLIDSPSSINNNTTNSQHGTPNSTHTYNSPSLLSRLASKFSSPSLTTSANKQQGIGRSHIPTKAKGTPTSQLRHPREKTTDKRRSSSFDLDRDIASNEKRVERETSRKKSIKKLKTKKNRDRLKDDDRDDLIDAGLVDWRTTHHQQSLFFHPDTSIFTLANPSASASHSTPRPSTSRTCSLTDEDLARWKRGTAPMKIADSAALETSKPKRASRLPFRSLEEREAWEAIMGTKRSSRFDRGEDDQEADVVDIAWREHGDEAAIGGYEDFEKAGFGDEKGKMTWEDVEEQRIKDEREMVAQFWNSPTEARTGSTASKLGLGIQHHRALIFTLCALDRAGSWANLDVLFSPPAASTDRLTLDRTPLLLSPLRRHRSCADLLSPLLPSPIFDSPPLSLIYSIRSVTNSNDIIQTIGSAKTLLATKLEPMEDVRLEDVLAVLNTGAGGGKEGEDAIWSLGAKRVEGENDRVKEKEDELVACYAQRTKIKTVPAGPVPDLNEQPHLDVDGDEEVDDSISILCFQTLNRLPTPDVSLFPSSPPQTRPPCQLLEQEVQVASPLPSLPSCSPAFQSPLPLFSAPSADSPASIQSPYTPLSSPDLSSLDSPKSVVIPPFPSPIPFQHETSFDDSGLEQEENSKDVVLMGMSPFVTSTPASKSRTSSDSSQIKPASLLSTLTALPTLSPLSTLLHPLTNLSPSTNSSLSRQRNLSSTSSSGDCSFNSSASFEPALICQASVLDITAPRTRFLQATIRPKTTFILPSETIASVNRVAALAATAIPNPFSPDRSALPGSPRVLNKDGHLAFRKLAGMVDFSFDSDSSAPDSQLDGSPAAQRLERRRSAPLFAPSAKPRRSFGPDAAGHYFTADTSFSLSDYLGSPSVSPSRPSSSSRPISSVIRKDASLSHLFSFSPAHSPTKSDVSLENFRSRVHAELEKGRHRHSRSFDMTCESGDATKDLMDISAALRIAPPPSFSQPSTPLRAGATLSVEGVVTVEENKEKNGAPVAVLLGKKKSLTRPQSENSNPSVSSPLSRAFSVRASPKTSPKAQSPCESAHLFWCTSFYRGSHARSACPLFLADSRLSSPASSTAPHRSFHPDHASSRSFLLSFMLSQPGIGRRSQLRRASHHATRSRKPTKRSIGQEAHRHSSCFDSLLPPSYVILSASVCLCDTLLRLLFRLQFHLAAKRPTLLTCPSLYLSSARAPSVSLWDTSGFDVLLSGPHLS